MGDGFNTIVLDKKGDVSVIRFKESDILDQINIQEIGEEMYRVADSTPGIKLVVDFKGVEYLSSTALGKLITLKRKVDAQNGEIRLCHIKEAILEVFSITKLDTIFTIKPTLEEAVSDF
jgi:anti-sigma B factor antagonist